MAAGREAVLQVRAGGGRGATVQRASGDERIRGGGADALFCAHRRRRELPHRERAGWTVQRCFVARGGKGTDEASGAGRRREGGFHLEQVSGRVGGKVGLYAAIPPRDLGSASVSKNANHQGHEGSPRNPFSLRLRDISRPLWGMVCLGFHLETQHPPILQSRDKALTN